jgi:hypothetical protein
MLAIILIITSVLVLAVALRFLAEPGPPEDNGITHSQENEARDEDPDVLTAVA